MKTIHLIREAKERLANAYLLSNGDKMKQWVEYYLNIFPALVYENIELIYGVLQSEETQRKLINATNSIKPGFTIPILSVSTQRDVILGIKLQNESNRTRNIVIYSDKLSEEYVSSQECFIEIIKSLTNTYDCWLISDHKRPASEYYKSLAQYLSINTDTPNGIKEIEMMLDEIKPAIVIPITQNKKFELLAKKSSLYSIHTVDMLFSDREVDYRLISRSNQRMELPGSRSIKYSNIDCPVFAPRQNSRRQYMNKTVGSSNLDEVIRFGAFCRLSKLDNDTLRAWALLLRKFKNAKLYFSYIQINKTSEAYTKSFFAELGVNPKKIIFLPRLDTNNYLKAMAQMDIILGSSPEQGGISCFDALMCNIPYIIYAANSTTFASSYILEKMGQKKWITYSIAEFISRVREELINIYNGKRIDLSQNCEMVSQTIKNEYISTVLTGADEVLEKINSN